MVFPFSQLPYADNHFIFFRYVIFFSHIIAGHTFRRFLYTDPWHILYCSAHRKLLCSYIILFIDHNKRICIPCIVSLCEIINPISKRGTTVKMESVSRIDHRYMPTCYFAYLLCCLSCEYSRHRHMAVNKIKLFL